jgi:uncharacterized protein (TIGR03437 family)
LLAGATLTPCALGQPGNFFVTTQNVAFATRVDGPTTATVGIAVAGNGAIPFQVRTTTNTGGDWLSVQQSSGTTPALINAVGNRQGLEPGAYFGSIEFTPATGSPVTVNAVLNVCVVPKTPLDPCFPGQGIIGPIGGLSVTPGALAFSVVRGTAAAQQLATVLDGGTPLDVTAQTSTTDGSNWLSIDHTSFRTPFQLQISAAGQNMAVGTYTGQVSLTAAGQPPTTISVQMRVVDPAAPVSAIDPAFVPAPSPDTIFTITGSGFRDGAQILLMLSTPQNPNSPVILPNAPIVVDSTTMRVLIPGTFLTQAGVLGVQVVNRDSLPSETLKVLVGHPAPAIRNGNGIVSAASLSGDHIAPGQLITLFGAAIGPAIAANGTVDQSGALAQNVSGVRVLFDGVPGGILYASDSQINTVVPNSIAGKTSTQVAVEYNGVRSTSVTMQVAPAAPGLFSLSGNGQGQVLAIRAGAVANGATQAIQRGEVVTLYATGTGLLDHSAGDGMLASGIERPQLPVSVQVGGQNADVLYAGTSPGLLEAVLQINIRLPQTTPQGTDVPAVLIVGNAQSPTGVTMSVK